METRAFAADFEPVALYDQNIMMMPDKTFWQVKFVEPIGTLAIDFTDTAYNNGNIAASTTTATFELRDLEVGERFLGQYRPIVLDPIEVQILQPRAIDRFGTRTVQPDFSPFRPATAGSRDVFVFGTNRSVHVQVTNIMDFALDRAVVYWQGWKYLLSPLTSKPSTYTTIPVAGLQPRDTQG